MTRDGVVRISDGSALLVRGNEITVQTLSFDPHEAGGRCGDADKNYPAHTDGRERLSGIVDRVCAVNRGGGNLTAATSQQLEISSVRRAVTSYLDVVFFAHSHTYQTSVST
jgi:hypothetical protein